MTSYERVKPALEHKEPKPKGGFIFAPIHVIQNGVPPENIMAWWETLQEYGTY